MSDKWLQKEGSSVPFKEWARSWRQTIECPLGQYPVMTAHIQMVRAYEDSRVEFSTLPDVVIPMASLSGEDLMGAAKIQEMLTKLIGDRLVPVVKEGSSADSNEAWDND